MCPHTTVYVSSYYYIYVLRLLVYYYIYICHHTTVYMCPHSPHTIIYVSVYYYMYVSSYSSYSYWCGGWFKKKSRWCRHCRTQRQGLQVLQVRKATLLHTLLIFYSYFTHTLLARYACVDTLRMLKLMLQGASGLLYSCFTRTLRKVKYA